MERIIHFEQFYYTNYGQGMRFEGNSTETARTASALELLAANWMKQELNEPVEMVLYNSHLGCYVSAMTVPCTQTGDARTSYWIHAVMPDEKESDGFMDCLSWPLQDYVTEVHLAQHLSPVTVRTETCDLSGILMQQPEKSWLLCIIFCQSLIERRQIILQKPERIWRMSVSIFELPHINPGNLIWIRHIRG